MKTGEPLNKDEIISKMWKRLEERIYEDMEVSMYFRTVVEVVFEVSAEILEQKVK